MLKSVLHVLKYTANLYLQMQNSFAVNFGTLISVTEGTKEQ